MSQKCCSKCNQEFHCGNEHRGCWCENYMIRPETLQQLKADFENCLCEQCLAAYAAELPVKDVFRE
jgi:hypothetical protein